MRNIVAQVPRGEDFFDRPNIIQKILRRIESGHNIFMAAPRRVGKTSIMHYLLDNPLKTTHFIYTITQSVEDENEFYKNLLYNLLDKDFVAQLKKSSLKTSNSVTKILDRLKGIKGFGFGLELHQNTEIDYHEQLVDLLKSLDMDKGKIVMMIDEFPETVENIIKKHGEDRAKNFLQKNRELRQNPEISQKIQFMYTGSIGLPVVVKKVGSTSLINDLNVIEITALSLPEAEELTRKLLKHYSIEINEPELTYLLTKIGWLIPFHIQLAVQEIIDVHETEPKAITNELIDQAFDQMVRLRNNIYFDSYLTRLKKSFSGKEYTFALKLLKEIAEKGLLDSNEIFNLAAGYNLEQNFKRIIESLIHDGYINNNDDASVYRFTSSVLKLWWNKNVDN